MSAAEQEVIIQEMTPGEIIAELDQIREERKRIAQRDKELVELWRVLEGKLIELGDKLGMKRMSSDSHTATITQEVLPTLEDFDALWEYIKENDAPHLLQRRVSAGAYRELQDAGVDIPGITPYVQRKISLRKI